MGFSFNKVRSRQNRLKANKFLYTIKSPKSRKLFLSTRRGDHCETVIIKEAVAKLVNITDGRLDLKFTGVTYS